jgi:signal transduction histidine kinase
MEWTAMVVSGYNENTAVLLRVVQDIALARDLDDVTGIVKRAARTMTGADGVTFVLKDGESCYYADEDAIAPLWKGNCFPMGACISGWAMIHRQTVAIDDIYADDRIPHDAYRPTFVKSLMMVPVRSADPIAAIGAYWAEEHQATDGERALLQTLADTAAVAIDNVQLIEALRRKAEESTRHLEQFKAEVARREELEEQFRQSQKMEAIGRLAGGVAHDFNNMLTVISGYGEQVLGEPALTPELREDVGQMVAAAERAAALTHQLLAFSRKQVLQPAILDLNATVNQMDKMLQRLIGEDIDLVTCLDPHLDPVEFDPGQIEQIIMNLAVNARDAMPRGGKLTINTANIELSEEYAKDHVDAVAGPHVMIAVTDTGTGMDAETRARIFEPFFTTKEKGKGTGLGLATVYGIVKQSGGNIWVYSEPGHGTTFKVYLPRSESAVVEVKAETTKSPVTGTETILLVEDDEAVQMLLRRTLTRGGYTVLVAGNPEAAQQLAAEFTGSIDMLLSDVVMPGMGGPELARRLSEHRPNMKVVFISGYTDEAIVHHGVLDPGASFIEKPISPRVLLEKVRQFLS